MISRRLALALAGAGVLASALAPRPAHGAAAVPCAPAAMFPAATSIPVNFPGFGYTALKATAADVHLVKSGEAGDVPIDVGPVEGNLLKVAPKSALAVGASYTLSFDAFCSYGPYPQQPPLTFTVAPASPLPTAVGTIVGAPSVRVDDFGTSRFTLSAKYNIDPAMAPWSGVYVLGLLVDGKPIETKATVSAGKDSVAIDAVGWCDDALAAKPTHDVTLRARLPFAPMLTSAATAVSFACPAPKLTTPTPGPLPTATPSAADGGTTGDAGHTNGSSGSSGGCSAAGSRGTSPAALTALVLALVVAVRRRIRREGGV